MPDDDTSVAAAPGEARGYVPELDGLRGIAILLVMIHRMYPRPDGGTPWPVEAGWIGVDLFFVISGFLIAGILLDTRRDPDYFRNFYARRVLRIFPLFYLLVGGMLLAFPLAHHREFLQASGSPLWYLLQLGNVPESLLGRDPPYWLAPVWSLAIEEQFYLTFPLVVRLTDPAKLGRRLVGVALFALTLRLVTTALVPERERLQYLFTLCRLDTIAIGCLLAVVVRSPRYAALRARVPSLVLPVIAGALGIAVITELDRTTWFGRTFGYSVVAIGFAALVLLVIERRDHRATAILRVPALRYLGKLCFGLYLLHRPADTIVTAVAAHTPISDASFVWLPVKLAVAVGLATISWRLIERPFLRLKRRFTSRAHPMILAAATAAALGCNSGTLTAPQSGQVDARLASGTDAALGAPGPDGAQPGLGHVVYAEGALESPITSDLAAGLAAIAANGTASEAVFAKVGDSITASPSFLTCVGAGTCNLGDHADLAPTISFFAAGNAAGATPFARTSLAATGGWTAADVLAGSPSPLDQELAAIAPRYAVTLLGTNDVRTGRGLAAFGADLWTIVDTLRAHGAIPVLSTLPSQQGDPDSNAKIPLFNQVIRALAQGRGVPLIDLHQALAGLPDEGISSDGLHPTAAPDGACVLTTADLQYGYNTRNLLTLEALDRARQARNGTALDTTVTRITGDGSHANPFTSSLPITDLADTRTGESTFSYYPTCGLTATGHEIVYRVDLPAQTTITANVVDRGGVNVDIAILNGDLAPTSCVAGGDQTATATVGPGPVFIVIDSQTPATEGELLLVVE